METPEGTAWHQSWLGYVHVTSVVKIGTAMLCTVLGASCTLTRSLLQGKGGGAVINLSQMTEDTK